MNAVIHLHFSVAILTEKCTGVTCLSTGLISLKENVDALYKFMSVFFGHLAHSLLVPPDDFGRILVKVKHDMRTKPYLEILDDPDKYSWAYYSPLCASLQ